MIKLSRRENSNENKYNITCGKSECRKINAFQCTYRNESAYRELGRKDGNKFRRRI